MDHSDLCNELQNSESILTTFFLILDCQGEGRRVLTGVNIPDTVLYGYGKPLAWYFSHDNVLCKQQKTRMTSDNIYTHFLKKGKSVSGVKAVYMTAGLSEKGGFPVVHFRFADASALLHLLQTERVPGILQLYFDSKPSRSDGVKQHTIISCSWSRGCCMVDCVVNRHRVDDTSVSLNDRTASIYDPHLAPVKRLLSQSAHAQYYKVCNALVSHMEQAYHCAVINMVSHFRKDVNGNVWLLWCSSIRVRNISNGVIANGVLWSRLEAQETKQSLQKMMSRRTLRTPHSSGEASKCALCAEVPYGTSRTMVSKQWILVSLCAMDESCLPGAIPNSVLLLHPHITLKQFNASKTNPAWLSESMTVCDVCLRACIGSTAGLSAPMPAWLLKTGPHKGRTPLEDCEDDTTSFLSPQACKKKSPTKEFALPVHPMFSQLSLVDESNPNGVDFYAPQKICNMAKMYRCESAPLDHPESPHVPTNTSVGVLGILHAARRRLLSSNDPPAVSTPIVCFTPPTTPTVFM